MSDREGILPPTPWANVRARLRSRLAYKIALVVGLLALLAPPFLGSGYTVRFLTEMFMLITLAQAWNIIGGLSGYISFGQVVFFGLGAYTTGLLLARAEAPFLLALAGGVAVAVGFAVLIGFPILRLRGHYFAIATFGVAEAMRQLAATASGITGGGMGLNVPPLRLPDPIVELLGGVVVASSALFYFLMLVLLVACVATTRAILNSRLGYGLRAIRADEDAAAALGVDRTRYKTTAFAISSIFPALAGGIYATWFTYIDPVTVFSLEFSVNMVIMTLLGGIGTLWGPVVGGILLLTIGEMIWGQFLELHSAFLGVVLVLVVIFLPRGVVEAVRRGRNPFSPAGLRASLRRYSV